MSIKSEAIEINIFKYMKSYKKECVLGPLFKFIEASFELLVPLVVAQIIDVGIANYDKVYIFKMVGVLVLLGFAGLAFSITAQFFSAKAAVGFASKIRQALFRHIQSFSYTDIDTISTSTLITRMTSDINQIQTGVNLTLRLALRSPFVVFGAMIMAFTISFKAALVFVVSIPLIAAVIFAIMLVCIPLYKKVQTNLDSIMLIVRENLSGVRVIRAFCKENDEKNKFVEQNKELTRIQKYTGRISAIMNPATIALVNLAIVLLIYIGGVQVSSGIISQGEVVALYNYMSQILVELVKLATMIITLTKAVASANRVSAVLKTPSTQNFTDKAIAENGDIAVEFENVYMKYSSAADYSLSDISFTAKRGEIVGIIGGTGAGKSTLINLIPGFYYADKGSVKVNGVDVIDINSEDLRKKVGVVMQKNVLFSGTLRENMKWGNNDATDADILKAIKAAQAEDIINSKENGLDFVIEQNGRNLSGGQKQRLTIARALVKKPEILILDDSSSALDFATDAKLRRSLKELDFNTTVFVVSQRISSIAHADKIIVLDDGSCVGVGTHDELLNSSEVYKEIYNSQTGGGNQ